MKYHKLVKPTRAKRLGSQDEEIRSFAPIGFESKSETPPLILYIYDPIGLEVDYVDFCHAIRYAPEDMDITIHINSPGGNLNSCLAIINAIKVSEANIVTVVDGEAASAAAMIWLAGHTKVVGSEHTVVMLHGASEGYYPTKVSDIANSTKTTTRIIESLLDDLAKGFLTEDERSDIRKGVDVFLTGRDIIDRMGISDID